MKFALASDLHFEFGPIQLNNDENADVLVLAGDIVVADQVDEYVQAQIDLGCYRIKSLMVHNFMKDVCSKFSHVIYIAGNHEHYHGNFTKTIPHLRKCFEYLDNLHILDKESITINDVTFIGGTLWTDMNNRDSLTVMSVRDMMNDYKHTRFGDAYRRLRPEDTVLDHENMIKYINQVVAEKHDQKFVVVGHHAPCKLSVKPRYSNDTILNGAYSSDLSEFILDRPQIKCWVHGHTHDTFDYMIGSTRIVCNPRGYIGYEERAEQFELKYIEV